RKEKKKKFKNDPFKTANWEYDGATDSFICPNNRRLNYIYESNRTDKYGFKRTFKVYESECCSDCPVRSLCTKAAEGKNRKLFYNEKWECQKEYVREKLSNEETGEIYGKRKIDVEPVFGFLKANLGFTRISVRGKPKVHNEIGFALMAVNLRKYSAINNENETFSHKNIRKNGCVYLLMINTTVFVYLRLVMSQPLRVYLNHYINSDIILSKYDLSNVRFCLLRGCSSYPFTKL